MNLFKSALILFVLVLTGCGAVGNGLRAAGNYINPEERSSYKVTVVSLQQKCAVTGKKLASLKYNCVQKNDDKGWDCSSIPGNRYLRLPSGVIK